MAKVVGIGPTHELWRGNTLAAPNFKNPDGSLMTFDFAVANPPFSAKAWSSGLNPAEDEFDRLTGFGIPPAKNGDYAFLLHLIKSLKSKGKGAIILPHGILFRGNKEADIRRNLVQRGLIKGIIGLPANLFYGTGIPACIVVIDKENAHARASPDGPKMRSRRRGIPCLFRVPRGEKLGIDIYGVSGLLCAHLVGRSALLQGSRSIGFIRVPLETEL
jgi:type I restriction-modification system DNA methylase subunit